MNLCYVMATMLKLHNKLNEYGCQMKQRNREWKNIYSVWILIQPTPLFHLTGVNCKDTHVYGQFYFISFFFGQNFILFHYLFVIKFFNKNKYVKISCWFLKPGLNHTMCIEKTLLVLQKKTLLVEAKLTLVISRS